MDTRTHDRFNCLDCGQDTAQLHEYYMLRDDLWRQINPTIDGMLCIGCVEKRLGRRLQRGDKVLLLIGPCGGGHQGEQAGE